MTVADLVHQFSRLRGLWRAGRDGDGVGRSDEQAFIDVFDIYSNTGVFALRRDVASARSNIYSVDEEDSAGYLQGDFNTGAVRVADARATSV